MARKKRHGPDPVDPSLKRLLRMIAGLMCAIAPGIITVVNSRYPTTVQLVVGLPALAAVAAGIAAIGASEKRAMVERTLLAVGLIALSSLVLLALHLLSPSTGMSSNSSFSITRCHAR